MKNKNYQSQQDPCSRNAQGICKIYHEVLLLKNFSQTNSEVKNMDIIFMIYIILLLRLEMKIKT